MTKHSLPFLRCFVNFVSCWCVLVALLCQPDSTAEAVELTKFKLTHPLAHQVIQRSGLERGAGHADIRVVGELPKNLDSAKWRYRVVALDNKPAAETDWTSFDVNVSDGAFDGTARVAAGGWYRLEVQAVVGERVIAAGQVEPIGVGEVFVVAGQSYATNCNDEPLKVSDPHGRVVAFDSAKGTWAIANDPQPAPDGSNGGSIWPPLGDALAKEFRVPVAFANVAVGATSSMQWMPDGKLHPRLVQTGRTLGRFRAVLWQQGESDVIAKTSAEQYVANLKTIRESAAKAWGFEPPWLLAKSTHHPTVYNDPVGEGRIRSAIDELVKLPGFRPGPDTDTLKGENRGDAKSRRHFSGIGQRRAAEMWFAVLQKELATEKRSTAQALMLLNDHALCRFGSEQVQSSADTLCDCTSIMRRCSQ